MEESAALTSQQVQEQFHEGMLSIYERAKSECNYNATRFLQMVVEQGGLQPARSLLHSPGLSDGFVGLWKLKRLDLTMEALILRHPWRELFTEEERAIARRRLTDAGCAAIEEH